MSSNEYSNEAHLIIEMIMTAFIVVVVRIRQLMGCMVWAMLASLSRNEDIDSSTIISDVDETCFDVLLAVDRLSCQNSFIITKKQ